jgi:hypothetical protein
VARQRRESCGGNSDGKQLPMVDHGGQFFCVGYSIWFDNDTAMVPTAKEFEELVAKM